MTISLDASFIHNLVEGDKNSIELLKRFNEHELVIPCYALTELSRNSMKSPEDFKNEINIILSNYGVKVIWFNEDSMLIEGGAFKRENNLHWHDVLSLFPCIYKKVDHFFTSDDGFKNGSALRPRGKYKAAVYNWMNKVIKVWYVKPRKKVRKLHTQ